jgi:hypothetical protein
MWPTLPSWNDVKRTYNETKATVSRTYNQTKATITYNETKTTVAKTYNETKTTVVATTNKTVASTKETLKEGQKWVKDNKEQLIGLAKDIQKVGDDTTTAGLVGAVAGAPVAGVGAAPGLTVAAAGGVVSAIGTGLEIGINLISGNNKEAAGGAAVYVVGELTGMAVDKAIPGPNPDATPIIKEFLQAGQEAVKNKTSDAAKDVGKKLRE